MNANGMDAAVRLIIMSDSEIHHEAIGMKLSFKY